MSFLWKSDGKIVVFLLPLYIQLCFAVNYPNRLTQERHLQLFNMISKKDSRLDDYCACKNLSMAWNLLTRCEKMIKRCTASREIWLPNFQAPPTLLENLTPALNLRTLGKKELPFYVEEPYFKIIRKEGGNNQYENDDPFIPPRGKKRIIEPTISDLDYIFYALQCQKRNYLWALRNDQDIGHRMKRDKLSEILKYDETFFPNRG